MREFLRSAEDASYALRFGNGAVRMAMNRDVKHNLP